MRYRVQLYLDKQLVHEELVHASNKHEARVLVVWGKSYYYSHFVVEEVA